MQHFRRWLAAFDKARKYLQRSNSSIAGCGMVQKDHMTRLFPAHIHPVSAHFFQHIAVTHFGTYQFQMLACQIAFQTKVGHHRGDNTAACQQTILAHRCRHQRHDLVAIDNLALFIDNNQPVGIAIQRNANMRACGNHGLLQGRHMGGTNPIVDILAVGRNADGGNLCPQLPDCSWCNLIGRPIGAI